MFVDIVLIRRAQFESINEIKAFDHIEMQTESIYQSKMHEITFGAQNKKAFQWNQAEKVQHKTWKIIHRDKMKLLSRVSHFVQNI